MSDGKRTRSDLQLPSVFLSYSKKDADFAMQVRDVISELEVRTFIHGDLSAGENWPEKLRSEIRSADLVIALVTPHTLNSSWMNQELGAAWVLKKPILAIESRKDLISRLPLKFSGSVLAKLNDLHNPEVVARLIKEVERALAASHPSQNRRAS
jgi:TIR domain